MHVRHARLSPRARKVGRAMECATQERQVLSARPGAALRSINTPRHQHTGRGRVPVLPVTDLRHVRHDSNASIARRSDGFPTAPIPPPSDEISGRATLSTEPTSIGVVGGGITGLATAYYITKLHPRARVVIYETSPRFGGWLSSTVVPLPARPRGARESMSGSGTSTGTDEALPPGAESVLFEAGPRSLRPSGVGGLGLSLIAELGLRDEVICTSKRAPAALSRYVYFPDRLVRIPAPPAKGWLRGLVKGLVREPLFEGLLGAVLGETLRKGRTRAIRDESVGEFLSRRVGRGLVDRLVSAVYHGVYAGDVWRLSARSLMAGLWKAEGESGSLSRHAYRNWRRGQDGRTVAPSEEARLVTNERLKILPGLDADMAERMKSSSVYTFRKGLGQLSEALVAHLRRDGKVEFRASTAVMGVTRVEGEGEGVRVEHSGTEAGADTTPSGTDHSHLIWTASPVKLLDKVTDERLRAQDWRIPTVAVMTVNLYFESADLNPSGFGYLIPLATAREQNPHQALGVVFDNSYSPDPARPDSEIVGPPQDSVERRGTKLTVMLGGHHWHDRTTYPSEEEGLDMARSTLKMHLGIEEKPLVWRVNMQSECIPQYTVGHHDRLAAVHEYVREHYGGRVRFAGNYIHGVGVNDSLFSALETASGLAEPDRTGLDLSLDMIGGRAVMGSGPDGTSTIVRTRTWSQKES